MVRALVSLSSGLGLSSWGHFVFLGKTPLTVSLSTQVYKWVPLKLMMPGVTLRWTSIPSRGKYKYSLSLKLRLDGPLGSYRVCRHNLPTDLPKTFYCPKMFVSF